MTTFFEKLRDNDVVGILDALEHGANPNQLDVVGCPALIYALDIGCDLPVIQGLLDYGADPNCESLYNLSPLHYAANAEYVKLLLKYGARPNQGCEPELIYVSDIESAKALIEAGADIDAVDDYGQSILHHLVREQDPNKANIIRYMLDMGLDVNATDEDNKTALFNVWGPDMFGVIDLLLEAGIDTTIVSDHGTTAIQHMKKGTPDAQKYAAYIEHRLQETKLKGQDSCDCYVEPNFF